MPEKGVLMHRRLHLISGSPYCWTALLALEHKGLEYEARILEASKGDQKTPEFLKLNPHGQVPVLEDGDTVMYETLAILAYLDKKYPDPPLFGTTAEDTGRIWRTALELESQVVPSLSKLVRLFFRGQAKDRPEAVQEAATDARTQLQALEDRLATAQDEGKHPMSAADYVFFPHLGRLVRAAGRDDATDFNLNILPLETHYPALGRWMKRIEAMPGYDRTYPPHWKS